MVLGNFKQIKLQGILLFFFGLILSSGLLAQKNDSTRTMQSRVTRIQVQYNMGGYFYGKEAVFGGLFGIKVGIDSKLHIDGPIYFWAGPWFRYNYLSRSSSDSDLSSNGQSGSSNLSEYCFIAGVQYRSSRIYGGYRSLDGRETSSYDWWTDYTSEIAWDGRYADYQSSKSDKLELSGLIIGVNHSIAVKRKAVPYILDISIATMLIDLVYSNQSFYYLDVNYSPHQKGIMGFASCGFSSIAELFELSFGAGYQF